MELHVTYTIGPTAAVIAPQQNIDYINLAIVRRPFASARSGVWPWLVTSL